MSIKRSPLSPSHFPVLRTVPGVRVATVAAGVKHRGRPDLFLAELVSGTTVAGVLTRSRSASAPVDWCRQHLPRGRARAIIANAGNANAFTGKCGVDHVHHMVRATSSALGCPQREVLVASTGVIGEPMAIDRVTKALPRLVKGLESSEWKRAAQAIMTTDTFPKGATTTTTIDGVPVTITGIAKGSGMIAPDMGTMLAFVFTDAAVPAAVLQRLLQKANELSFNCITVDGDTSTSDTLLLAATGKAKNRRPRTAQDPILKEFKFALTGVLTDLATQVVRDGEGASKFVTIDVTGAASSRAARRVGLAIGNSPLVKTAIAGEDANWGRIVMAVGKAGERADRDKLKISIGGVVIAEKGQRATTYDEATVTNHLRGREIHIEVDLGIGRGRARIWTCDLTYDYIRINADYRT